MTESQTLLNRNMANRGPDSPLATPQAQSGTNMDAQEVSFNPYDGPERHRPADLKSSTSSTRKQGVYGAAGESSAPDAPWIPIPLKTWFVLALASFMVAVAIAIEVALHFSQIKNGWPTKNQAGSTGVLHFVYTLPPTAIAIAIVGLWTWVDLEVKKMQPYIDLTYGNARPETTILLDYTRTSNYLVWLKAFRNRHYIVALSAVMVVIGLTCQPLGAALLTVKSIWLPVNGLTSTTGVTKIGQNPTFTTLVPFVAAAGYAQSAAVFKLGNPKFIVGGVTVAEFDIPTQVGNGTAFVDTTAITSVANCAQASNTVVSQLNSGSFSLNSSLAGCSARWIINTTSPIQFGVDIVRECTDNSLQNVGDQYKPPVFWIFDTSSGTPQASVTYCKPNISFSNVVASVNVQTQLLNSIAPKTDKPFASSDGGNVTGQPMLGRAFNGVAFNLSTAADNDPFIQNRMTALQAILPAAIYQIGTSSEGGIAAMFANNAAGWANITDTVYTLYLALIAQGVYHVTDDSKPQFAMLVRSFQARLLFSPVATHLLAALLILLAILGVIVNLLHRRDRSLVELHHQPGTIASAAAVVSHTDVGEKLHARQRDEDIIQEFKNKRLRIDRATGKIVLEGDEGYEMGQIPNYNRRSVWGLLGLPSSPKSPRHMG